MNPLTPAKLAQLAAQTQLALVKAQQNKHWPGELHQELAEITNLARDLLNSVANEHT